MGEGGEWGILEWGWSGAHRFCMVFVVDSSPKKEVETVFGANFGVWGVIGHRRRVVWELQSKKKYPGLGWGSGARKFCVVFVVDSSSKKEVETGTGRNFGVWGMGECGRGFATGRVEITE